MTSEKLPASSGPVLASVIILTYNEEKNIGRCLDAVFRQRLPGDFEVIVVDSGSTDRTREIANAYPVRLFEIPRADFGHGRTRQWASERALGEYIVYLVADALPADEDWLHALIRPLTGDETVAGSYSRQVPRQGAHPVEESRIRDRTAGRGKRIVRQITKENPWVSLEPLERLELCDFDDVSACRRRSVLEKIPIPEVPWAEDLYWSRQVLQAGFKTAFEPDSTVIHSHGRGLAHDFRRGWLDQRVAEDLFGHIYFEGPRELFRKYLLLLGRRWKIIAQAGTGFIPKAMHIITLPAYLAAEVCGNYLASRKPRVESVSYDFIRKLGRARLEPSDAKARVMPTRFPAEGSPRPVLFSNPNSQVIFRVGVPERALLRFAAGINPRSWPMRRDPVRFSVEIDRERVWECEVAPAAPEEFLWHEAEIDLSEHAGRTVEINLATSAEDTDHAWSGWAEPRISRNELGFRDRVYNGILEWLTARLLETPLRHP